MRLRGRGLWILTAGWLQYCLCYQGGNGPADDEDDVRPWPCPFGMTWQRCAVNLTCSDKSDEEAVAVCGPGCYCPKRRFLYNGNCITKDECPSDKCGEHMQYSDCGNYCREMCPGLLPPDSCKSDICYEGCFCEQGRRKFAGQCYLQEDCPNEPIEQFENFVLFDNQKPELREEEANNIFLKRSFQDHV